MEERFDELKTRLAEIHDLRRSLEMLFWDQTVMMPPGGGPVRGQQLTTLDRIAHEKFVSDEIGVLLGDLAEYDSPRLRQAAPRPRRARCRDDRRGR